MKLIEGVDLGLQGQSKLFIYETYERSVRSLLGITIISSEARCYLNPFLQTQ